MGTTCVSSGESSFWHPRSGFTRLSIVVVNFTHFRYLFYPQDEQEPEGEDLVDSEEYDEDEDEERRRKKRKKKDSRYGGFIIDEAEVSNM